jgi:hypothetical protein
MITTHTADVELKLARTDDPQTQRARDTLFLLLRKYRQCFVLIDPQGTSPRFEALHDTYAQCERTPIVDALFVNRPDLAPYLLTVTYEQFGDLSPLYFVAREEACSPALHGRSIGAFLFGNATAEALCAHLKRQMDARARPIAASANLQQMFFRYFDPRVMRHLVRILSSMQLEALLKGIDHWHYVTEFDSLVELKSATTNITADMALGPLLDAAQWQQLDEVEAINLAIRHLHAAQRVLLQPQWTKLIADVAEASAIGLTDNEDRAAYASYRHVFGATLNQHPQFRTLLDMTQHGAVPLAESIPQLTKLSLQDTQGH